MLAKDLIGKTIYVDWPYLNEAMVHSISDGAVQYYQVSETKSTHLYRSVLGKHPWVLKHHNSQFWPA